jgi:hypothetical protein
MKRTYVISNDEDEVRLLLSGVACQGERGKERGEEMGEF